MHTCRSSTLYARTQCIHSPSILLQFPAHPQAVNQLRADIQLSQILIARLVKPVAHSETGTIGATPGKSVGAAIPLTLHSFPSAKRVFVVGRGHIGAIRSSLVSANSTQDEATPSKIDIRMNPEFHTTEK